MMTEAEEPLLLAQCRPITCIDLTDKFIIVCEGPGLSVFSKDGEKLHQMIIFPSHKTILGVSIYTTDEDNFLLFAYGQNASKVFYCDKEFKVLGWISPNSKKDHLYLSDATYIASRWLDNGKKLAALTDENILHVYSWDAELEVNVCRDCNRSIIRGVQTSLFSGTISGTSEENLIVFSGTNLSQIYVWHPIDLTKNYHILIEGIKGSVLSLKYSEKDQILVASSDQRSVFAWRLENSSSPRLHPTLSAFINGSVNVSLISEMIGHTGRVWQVDILDNHIVSTGQDSNLLLWSTTGRLQKIFSGPSVVNVRCCRLESDGKSVVSGSDDGSICQWNLSDPFSTATVDLTNLGTDYPRQVVFYNSKKMFVTMNSGKFLLVDKAGNAINIFSHPEFSSYSTFALSPQRNYLVIGSKTGWVYILRNNLEKFGENNGESVDCAQTFKFDSKIVSLHYLDDGIIVVSTCTAVIVLESASKNESVLFEEKMQLKINWKDKPGVAGAIALIKDSETYLILGDEVGNVHLFNMKQDSQAPVFTISKLHGIYGVCDFKHGLDMDEVWSVGRNRLIINLKLSFNPNPRLDVVQAIESCLNWNAKLITSNMGSFVCGFSENDFVILDMVEDRIVKKFACGGAHRSWDVQFNSLFTFAFIRHKVLTVSEFGLDSSNIQNGIVGGKTINAITTCPDLTTVSSPTSRNFGILTAGEDAFLRYSTAVVDICEQFSPKIKTVRIAKLKAHASSIRVIKYHFVKDINALEIFSGGGRSQIVASCLQYKDNNVVWSQKGSIMLQNFNHKKQASSDPDMRIMDICLTYLDNNHYILLCACSDGYIRRVNFHLQKFTLINSFNHYQAEVNLHAFTHVSSVDELGLIYGTNSQGQLILFSLDKDQQQNNSKVEISHVDVYKTNDAAITALCHVEESAENYIVTGSDDGVVKVFRMQCLPDSHDSSCNWTPSLIYEDRIHHSAAINSVVFKNKLIFAASADQIVTFRKLPDGKAIKSFRCGVNDIQSMAVTDLTPNSVVLLLGGQGFEMRKIDF